MMMRVGSILCVSLVVVCSLAEGAGPSTNAIDRAAFHDKMMRMMGGRLRQPGSGMGFVAIFNGQNRVPSAELEALVKRVTKDTNIDFRVIDGAVESDLNKAKKAAGAGLAVAIVDDPTMPDMMIMAPESGWGKINVSVIAADKPDDKALAQRVRAETLRTFALLAGGVGSQYPGNIMDPIRQPKKLEGYDEALPVDVMGKFQSYGAPFGIKPYRIAFYRQAVQEGWAPPPTDEYQKACLERIEKERAAARQAKPDPLKIKYDPKKGE